MTTPDGQSIRPCSFQLNGTDDGSFVELIFHKQSDVGLELSSRYMLVTKDAKLLSDVILSELAHPRYSGKF